MKTDCEIIKDLLPLYAENMVSDKSKEAVEEHLGECQNCQDYYQQFLTPEPQVEQRRDEAKNFQKFVRRKKCSFGFKIAIASAIVVVGIIFILNQLIYGTESVVKGSGEYGRFTGEGVYSPLIVFPEKETEYITEEFYYKYRDEIFSPVCQVYLKREYSHEQFLKEIERLRSEQLTYAGQTNQLYVDEQNFTENVSYIAYVALADWNDKYEYALVMEDTNTIIYVYLHNMTKKNLYMDEAYLPVYFQDNNESESTQENMTATHQSFYAFKFGDKYIDCMDLVN